MHNNVKVDLLIIKNVVDILKSLTKPNNKPLLSILNLIENIIKILKRTVDEA